MSLAAALVLLLVLIPLVLSLLRANELFCLKLRDGRLHIARGRIPQALLDDLADVLRDPPVTRGTLRGVIEDRRVQVRTDAELTDAQRQRIRNVVAAWPIARVRNAPRPRR
jgi:hypothetical protein